MEINQFIESEVSILLNARKLVIITFILLLADVLIFWFLLLCKLISIEVYRSFFNMIAYPLVTAHAYLCGSLYMIISKNKILSIIIGILIVVFSWFALGIGTYLLTIYLLVQSSITLKKAKRKYFPN
jgi:cytochrome c biogenesis factor